MKRPHQVIRLTKGKGKREVGAGREDGKRGEEGEKGEPGGVWGEILKDVKVLGT